MRFTEDSFSVLDIQNLYVTFWWTANLCVNFHCWRDDLICIGYFQNGLKPFSCYVKISYDTKVIE
jgi:hypothetical protein